MQYESLIFDIDGTLWDSRALIAEEYNIQLAKEGLPHLSVSAETFRSLFGKVNEEIADTIFPTVPKSERYDLMQRCMEAGDRRLQEDECRIGYPGVRETLEALSKNHRLFIVSNSQKGYPELCMEKLGLGAYISGHLCYGETGTSKGTSIRTLMKMHDIQNCAYIGDTQMDYEATQEAGVPFIWAAYGFGTPENYVRKIDSIKELLDLPEVSANTEEK